jgi:CRP-like cAMP-binding protein
VAPPDPNAVPRRNLVLGALPAAEFDRLAADLELVHLARDVDLELPNEEIEYVYFPTSGIASIVALGVDGESVDTTMVGREGMTDWLSSWARARCPFGRWSRCPSQASV